MTDQNDSYVGKDPKAPRAEHGVRNEVSWEDGKGRQPYANQGDEETGEVDGGEFSEGNRGELSGRNLDQLDEVKKKP